MASLLTRTCGALALGMVFALATTSIRAQSPPAKRAPSGEAAGSSRLSLLFSPDIQKDLGLSPKQDALIDRLWSKLAQKQREADSEAGKEGREAQAAADSTAAFQHEVESQLAKVLNKRQKDRLAQLGMQRLGSLAVIRKDVAAKLKLSAAQQKKRKAIIGEMRAEMRRAMPQFPNALAGDKEPADGAPAAKGNDRRGGNPEGQRGNPDGPNPGQGGLGGGRGFSGGPMAWENFFFPPAGYGLPGGGGPAGGFDPDTELPNLETPEFREKIAKMREAHAKIKESTTKQLDELLTKEQKDVLGKMFGKPFDFSKMRPPGSA